MKSCHPGESQIIHSNYRLDIQGLRGLAVVLVVLFHMFPTEIQGGYVGVDIFFVISGYVIFPMVHKFCNRGFNAHAITSFRHYLWRRFLRLAPAFALFIVSSILLFLLFGKSSNSISFFLQSVLITIGLGNYSAFRYSGDYFNATNESFLHMWSLAVEFQIYLIYPLLLLALNHCQQVRKKSGLILFLLILLSFFSFTWPNSLSSLYTNLGIASESSLISFYSPFSRYWQFALGGIAGIRSMQVESEPKKKKFSDTIIIFIIVFVSLATLESRLASTASSLIAFYLLKYPANFTRKKPLVWIGDRSYSIYLFHIPILIYFRPYLDESSTGSNPLVGFIAITIGILIVSNLSFKYFENRFRNPEITKAKRRWHSQKQTLLFFGFPLLLSILMLAMMTNFGKDKIDLYEGMGKISRCKTWAPSANLIDASSLQHCFLSHGKGILVIGDSHAMNIFNAISRDTESRRLQKFVIGISRGGCRVYPTDNICFEEFSNFLQKNSKFFEIVVYHQSGSYLIKDENGKLDSEIAFDTVDSFEIDRFGIISLIGKLSAINGNNLVIWVGPFMEARNAGSMASLYLKRGSDLSTPVQTAFKALESEILSQFQRNGANGSVRYFSLIDYMGSKGRKMRVGTCRVFRDADHLSYCGEKLYGRGLLTAISKESRVKNAN